jgi:hypothetical protein
MSVSCRKQLPAPALHVVCKKQHELQCIELKCGTRLKANCCSSEHRAACSHAKCFEL